MPTCIPLLVLSDPPTAQSGLARITRDVISRLLQTEDLARAFEITQLSVQPVGRMGWNAWPLYTVDDLKTYGAATIQDVWHDCYGTREGILFTIWDPARIAALAQIPGPWRLWGYFPIDGHNVNGGISGAAGDGIVRYDRVLAYTRWGSRILKSCRSGPVPYLPHGLDRTWTVGVTRADEQRALQILGSRAEGRRIVGMVATNQRRKDLGVFCQTIATLRRRGHPVYGWLHTDRLDTEAWCLPQLAADCNLFRHLTVSGITEPLSDTDLHALYAVCSCTMLSSLGEGFGYPIVESLAAGTPCVHTTHGGGAELVPKAEWKVPVRAWRLGGPWALQRPVLDAEDFANAIERAWSFVDRDPTVAAYYCGGSVAQLQWDVLWPRWASWWRDGLKEW